ncbi:hypothetical protein [Massilia sp. BJB1822]|uniref:hypothetical protein n=1 Tax=Massilia sp. BJB1822 TaxID=2744470 RepID=UPI001594CAC1|nr:hypothetical protein [Massilia sp. BJB1822]NVD96768.1 hypothetical protein [Massilia sp. BJB1822]
MTRNGEKTNRPTVELRIGLVSVRSPQAEPDEMQAALEASEQAKRGLLAALGKPGIELDFGQDTPVYFGDPEHPELVIQQWRGRETRGQFVDGEFQELP